MHTSQKTKTNKKIHIFVMGAIYSGIGKGVFTAALGKILEKMGFKVVIKKGDGYMNSDAGTINPNEHGEVFVTADGKECDMDLGNYERMMNYETKSSHITTLGAVLFDLLKSERSGNTLLGKTVEYFHVEKKIVQYIESDTEDYEIVICEVGGVIGDDGNSSILRSISRFKEKIIICMSYCLWLENMQEFKARPTIVGIQTLMRSYGIYPDLLVMRSHKELRDEDKQYFFGRLGQNFEFCENPNNILFVPDLVSSYLIYGHILKGENTEFINNLIDLMKNKFPQIEKQINKKLAMDYVEVVDKVGFYDSQLKQLQDIKILLVGKYDLLDSYSSIYHSIAHSASQLSIKIQLIFKKAGTFSL